MDHANHKHLLSTMDFFENYWLEIVIGFFIWNAAIIIASIIYQKRKRSRQAPFDDSNPEFYESWVSGHSGKNFLTRLGGASRCLKVSVNSKEVYVRPFAAFGLGFISEIMDLEHRISRERILSISKTSQQFGEDTVRVVYSDAAGQERSFDLILKNKNDFVSLLQQPSHAT